MPALAQSAAGEKPAPRTNQFIVPVTLSRSPAESIRRLLEMNETARQNFLAQRSPEYRRSVESKLKEYQALSADERERRFNLIDLRWHLPSLMALAPPNRAERLTFVPPAIRPAIDERLKQWDQLPGAERDELLTNQMTISYFLRLNDGTAVPPQAFPRNFPNAQGNQVATNLASWGALPDDARQKMVARFQQFFDLDDKEKEKVLGILPSSERQQLKQALQVFEKLPIDRRDASIRGVKKFINLSSDERGRFLQNAARWQAMPSTDRQAWRELVNRVPDMPPLPPGLLPPLPPGLEGTPAASSKSN